VGLLSENDDQEVQVPENHFHLTSSYLQQLQSQINPLQESQAYE